MATLGELEVKAAQARVATEEKKALKNSNEENKINFEQKKESEKELRKLTNQINKSEKEIERLETEIKQMDEVLMDPEKYKEAIKTSDIFQSYETLKKSLEKEMDNWAQWSEKLEGMRA